MSRRARRRGRSAGSAKGKAQGGKASARGKRGMGWVWRSLSILALVLILAGFGGYFWLKKYLHSDEFRVFMGDTVGSAMSAEASFGPFKWQGMQVATDSFVAEGDDSLRLVRADGIRAKVGLGELKSKTWQISGVRVNQLDLHIDTTPAPVVSAKSADVVEEINTDSSGGEAGFLAGLLPDKAELVSADISNFNLNVKTAGGHFKGDNMVAIVDASKSTPGAYGVKLTEGRIETSWFPVPINLNMARGRYADGKIFIHTSESQVYQRGQLTLEGELDGDNFGFFGTLGNVRSEELLPQTWQKRLTGDLVTQFKVQSHPDGTILRGKLKLKKGILTALPLLDRIAAYSNTRRFRRLNLSEAKLSFRKQGDILELTDIVLASEGLIRVVGNLTIKGDQLDGRFRVGITPGTLAHIPGAETKVFVRGDSGLLWSPLRITGTMDAPKEDLSNRMIVAAGERMFEMVPETGKMVLKFAHDTATELPRKAVETGTDVIRETPSIIGDGVRGVFDLIPGP